MVSFAEIAAKGFGGHVLREYIHSIDVFFRFFFAPPTPSIFFSGRGKKSRILKR
jgi:hypothetical protein